MHGHFKPIALIGLTIEEEAKKEQQMEKKAKELDPDWRHKLKSFYLGEEPYESELPDSNFVTLLDLCNDDYNFKEPIITDRNAKFTFTKTPVEMVKTLRWYEDHLPHILGNIERNNEKVQISTSQDASPGLSNPQYTISDIVKQGHLTKLYKAIQKCEDIDLTNKDGDTALLIATREGKYLAAALLLYEGASALHQNQKGENVFQESFKHGNNKLKNLIWSYIKRQENQYDVFCQLCKLGDVNGVQYCLYSSNTALCKKMIEFNNNEKKQFPLLQALEEGEGEVSRLLISYHLKLNPRYLVECDASGTNALILASEKGYIDTVNQLLPLFEENNVITACDSSGRNALLAASGGWEEIVEILFPYFEREGKVTDCDHSDRNSLIYASWYGSTKILNMLLPQFELSGKVTDCDCLTQNALHLATESGNIDIVKILSSIFHRENKLEETTYKGETALSIAKRRHYPKIIELLETAQDS